MTELRRRAANVTSPLAPVAALLSAAPAAPQQAEREKTARSAAQAVRIEVRVVGRWNACALLDRLAPYESFLIQHGAERWVVHAQTPGRHGESAECAIAAIEECLGEHGVGEAPIRIDGKPYRPAVSSGSRS